jgi:hypothetical protein
MGDSGHSYSMEDTLMTSWRAVPAGAWLDSFAELLTVPSWIALLPIRRPNYRGLSSWQNSLEIGWGVHLLP